MKQERTNKYINIFLISFSVISFALLAISQLFWPYDLDHGIFATVADVILDGGVVYRDIWELKGPAVYYIFAFVNWLCDREEYGIRIFDLVIVITGLYYFYKILELSPNFNKTLAIMTTSLLGSLYFYSVSNSAQPDGWISILMVFILYLLLKDDGKLKIGNATLIAIFLGIIGLLKPPYLIYSLVPLCYILTITKPIRNRFNFIFTIALGSFLILYVAAIYFWYNNALWDLIDNIFIYNWNFHKGGILNIKSAFQAIINDSFYQNTFIIILPSIIGFIYLLRENRKIFLLLFVWGISTFLIIYVQIRPSGSAYKNLLIYPIIVLYFYYSLLDIKSTITYRNTLIVCFVIISITYNNRYNSYISQIFYLYTNQISEEKYRQNVQTRDDKNILDVVKYLKKVNFDNKPIFIFGISSNINFFSDNTPTIKYSYIMPFHESKGEYFDRISYDLLYRLNKSRPKYFIFSGIVYTINKENSKEEDPFLRISGLKYFINKNYKFNKLLNGYFIYEARKSQ